MSTSGPDSRSRWRVALTRDEASDRSLRAALVDSGFEPVSCVVMEEEPPADPTALGEAALTLERYDWVVFASARSVRALLRARGTAWPKGIRTAAVGPQTAKALVEAGADPPPVVADLEGADALWNVLKGLEDWAARRVLVPTVPGGLQILATQLRNAGARVHEVEAYRMSPRPEQFVRADWAAAEPDAVVIVSPSGGHALVRAIGAETLNRVCAVVSIGPTTSSALSALGVVHTTAPRSQASEVARHLTRIRAAHGPI
ncbi:MAG: uroporphyrinogen-III synthase [Vicinamibacterales bacterium]